MKAKSNIVLIGMPGSGKSTVGVILAKRSSHDFVDTDVVIQSVEHRSLQAIMDKEGYMKLREIEARVLQTLNLENHIISTGGSAVYSDAAMVHLRKNGTTIYLDVSLATLRSRITDYETRGIAKRPDQSFDDLFQERTRLYRQVCGSRHRGRRPVAGRGVQQDRCGAGPVGNVGYFSSTSLTSVSNIDGLTGLCRKPSMPRPTN